MAITIPPILLQLLQKPSISFTIIPLLLALYRISSKNPKRLLKVAKSGERVLILGASSGIGRSVARQYAARGARVCVVGRRDALVEEVAVECRNAQKSARLHDVLAVPGDFTNVGDMVRVRDTLEKEWNGLDTLVVAAGVSALQPLLAIAGVEVENKTTLEMTTQEGIQKTVDVAAAATHGNYVGPLVAAVTFVPLLSNTSKSPSILLVNSLASVIPAPTRTLYASTKAASLVLYQALSIEHPNITFTSFMPTTVEGDFRASAVDSGPVRELDPNAHGLKREDVARRCIHAVDNGEKSVFMPVHMRFGHLLYWVWPAFVERAARRKYNFGV